MLTSCCRGHMKCPRVNKTRSLFFTLITTVFIPSYNRVKDVNGTSIAPICQRGDVESENPTTTSTATTMTTKTSSTTTIPPTTTTSTNDCPYMWPKFNGSCYWVNEDRRTWPQAQKGCKDMNPAAHLASIGTEPENDFMTTLVDKIHMFSFAWLGGNDQEVEGY